MYNLDTWFCVAGKKGTVLRLVGEKVVFFGWRSACQSAQQAEEQTIYTKTALFSPALIKTAPFLLATKTGYPDYKLCRTTQVET